MFNPYSDNKIVKFFALVIIILAIAALFYVITNASDLIPTFLLSGLLGDPFHTTTRVKIKAGQINFHSRVSRQERNFRRFFTLLFVLLFIVLLLSLIATEMEYSRIVF